MSNEESIIFYAFRYALGRHSYAVGQVAQIPYTDELPYSSLQSSASAYLSKAWGNGSYTTATNKTTKCLEILRIK